MGAPLPLGELTYDFMMLNADDPPAVFVPRLRRKDREWTLIERTWGTNALYYVAHSEELLKHLIKIKADDDIGQSLSQWLELREEDSNCLIRNGRIWHPADRIVVHYDGKFAKGIIRMGEQGPTGIYFPPVQFGGPSRGPSATKSVVESPSADREVGGPSDCTLGATFPRQIVDQTTEELTITLAAGHQFVAANQTELQLLPNEPVTVRLSLSGNLELVDPESKVQEVQVPTDPSQPVELVYDIRGVTSGQAKIVIRLLQSSGGAQVLGYLELETEVVTKKTEPGVVTEQSGTYSRNGCPDPDLTIFIDECELEHNRVEVRFLVSDDVHLMKEHGSKIIPSGAQEFFKHEFSVIEGKPLQTDGDLKVVKYELEKKGRDLFENILSEEMRNLFRQRGDKIRTVQIVTESHHIPWEMVQLPAVGDRPEEFLAMRCQVCRWTHGFREPAVISVDQLIYTAPKYGSSGRQLKYVEEEVRFLESLEGYGINPTSISPSHTAPLIDALQLPFGIFHYVGHANAGAHRMDEPILELETEERQVGDTKTTFTHTLTPTHVSHLCDLWKNHRPLVFLNACQTGQTMIALSRLSGWAGRLLDSRAGAFIGTLWSIRDQGAHLFAKTFYRHALIDGMSIGESSLLARRSLADTGDPSWLAYVIYGHPATRLVATNRLPMLKSSSPD